MDPLETLLRPITSMVNRQLRNKTPARDLCRELAGRTVAVRVRHTALAMYFFVHEEALELKSRGPDEPDVVITGPLLSLARLAASGGSEALTSDTLDITGDVHVAQSFQRLLSFGRPDLEEELADVIGDAAAHGVGEVVRGIGRWSRDARETMRANVTEYLQEESRTLPGRYEADRFRREVDALRDDVDRLEARLRRLERRKG